MEQIFWLRENKIAGRTGPNRDSWNPADFKAAGFSAILSVNHADMVDPAAIRAAGLKHANIPMSSNAPPLPDDHEICLRNLPLALQFIEANIPIGPVIIHYRSGKDRTGLVMAAALMKLEDLTPDEAMDEVFRVRPIAFSAEGWREYGRDVLVLFHRALNDTAH